MTLLAHQMPLPGGRQASARQALMKCVHLAGAAALAVSMLRAHASRGNPRTTSSSCPLRAAGSASDSGLRLVERMLHEKKLMDVSSTIVNKPGGGGNIGWTYINQQPPDGHTLTLIIGNLISNQIIGRSTLAYTDLACVVQLFSEYTAVGVRTDSP